jgi:hypothetical protein
MKLTLDHTQRLNLHALLGAHRADVGAIRAIWALQDKIAHSIDEEEAIGLKRDVVGCHEQVIRNPAFSVPLREFDFTEAELGRIKAAIGTWSGYAAASDRRWLEPLVEHLFAE